MSAIQQVVVEKQQQQQLTGQALKRMEDPKFITGAGKYVGDIRLPNMLHAAFVRSPHAHAKIIKVDVSRAAAHPNVRFVLTGREIVGIKDIPTVRTYVSVDGGMSDNIRTALYDAVYDCRLVSRSRS